MSEQITIGYFEEFYEKEINNDRVFSLQSERAENKLSFRLPRIDDMLVPHPLDHDVEQTVRQHSIDWTKKRNGQYDSIYAGARLCVKAIVESISGSTNEPSFDIIEAGSAFEHLKISEPLEFDFMLCERPMLSPVGDDLNDGDTHLEGQFKNLVIKKIYEQIDAIAFPTGWSLYQPGRDGETLEEKYKPAEFQGHPACQLHKRGTKIWFSYGFKDVLIDLVPCRQLDWKSQKGFLSYCRMSAPVELFENTLMHSFCYHSLDSDDLQSHMNNISTSVPEKKMLLAWHPNIRLMLRAIKFYCQQSELLSTKPKQIVSDNKGYVDSYLLKTLFIRIVLELKWQGVDDITFAKISPAAFLIHFVREMHQLFSNCEAKCCPEIKEYYVRFYHGLIAEEYMKRISVKWTESHFKQLSQKCETILRKVDECVDQNEQEARDIPIVGKVIENRRVNSHQVHHVRPQFNNTHQVDNMEYVHNVRPQLNTGPSMAFPEYLHPKVTVAKSPMQFFLPQTVQYFNLPPFDYTSGWQSSTIKPNPYSGNPQRNDPTRSQSFAKKSPRVSERNIDARITNPKGQESLMTKPNSGLLDYGTARGKPTEPKSLEVSKKPNSAVTFVLAQINPDPLPSDYPKEEKPVVKAPAKPSYADVLKSRCR